ncbi:DNA repair protein, ATPase [Alteracholeplasma palmae J233]|uniref:DNA repair protein RecN n=1 Tax=Alteracholeplasma palmae (strain ATCC 49389 / J233) TaxID=1318466 RepID=U4KLF4_ALTPJ|nr:DNA repair protein RecN [Alteracholeplasma palmae]CCV64648.1 DNA repair protein, ATPase [Alteracholeplasma palmae J233]
MLETLKVKDFALIDDIEVEFYNGLTALTGETGSGKSILLESLSLIFGKRADQDLIRYQKDKAMIKAKFRLTKYQQEKLSLPELIEIFREVDSKGKHQIKLNNEPITLAKLKEISKVIGLIHAQTDTFNIMDKGLYLDFLDQMDYATIDPLVNDYIFLKESYTNALKEYKGIKLKKEESVERIDFLTYQVKELEQLSLKVNEKEEVDEALSKLSNFDKIKQALQTSYEKLENDRFSLDAIYDSYQALHKVASFDKKYEDLSESLLSQYYVLDEVKNEIYKQLDSLDFDENEFNELQERSYELAKIETKYQKSINELIVYLEEIKDELSLITDYDNYVKKALEKVETNYNKALNKAIELSKKRKLLATILEKNILLELKDLDLEKSVFKIEFEPLEEKPELLENGIDKIEFMISLNEGEPVKILSKVASGGEKARFMFALKSIYAKTHQLSLLVLDEIDIGISGKTASKVASKMKELSKDIQTLVITHLPQVAAKADYHYLIAKEKVIDRMVSKINKLDSEQRVHAIALMLSDDRVTKEAIALAKSLLEK